MPWKIDDNNCVVRADTGKQMHCYPKTPEGKADAEKYLKALYANAPEHKHLVVHKAGNMAGLAKHLSHKIGADPSFFTKCMADEELADYDESQRSGICAKAHKLVVGKWPASQTDKGSIGKRAKQKKIVMKFKYHPERLGKNKS